MVGGKGGRKTLCNAGLLKYSCNAGTSREEVGTQRKGHKTAAGLKKLSVEGFEGEEVKEHTKPPNGE
jgi:preprotein translocase subunit Sec61beta